MWIAKLKIRHDCIIGNRCKEFNVTTTGSPFDVFIEKGITYSPQIQTLHGKEENINEFIKDLKKDKRIGNLEVEGNTIFLIEKRKEKIPATFYNKKIFFVKPVYVDKKGYEYWEVASWKKIILTTFIGNLEKEIDELEILKLIETKLTDIYSIHLAPHLSKNQRIAIDLAFEKGYYSWPRKTSLGKLAKEMKISIATFREHLKRAEEKLMPSLISQVKP